MHGHELQSSLCVFPHLLDLLLKFRGYGDRISTIGDWY
jgi:hypothetical protein